MCVWVIFIFFFRFVLCTNNLLYMLTTNQFMPFATYMTSFFHVHDKTAGEEGVNGGGNFGFQKKKN